MWGTDFRICIQFFQLFFVEIIQLAGHVTGKRSFPRRAFSRGSSFMPFVKSITAGYVLFCVPKENQKGRRGPQGMKAPVGLLSRRPVCAANAACSARQGLRYFRGAGGGGLRLPESALCLARHSHPAGRCPNSSSLFRPLAAVVAVAN